MKLSAIQDLFKSFTPGRQLIDGSDLQQLSQQLFSYANGIVAHAGGTQAAATNLTAANNEVTVCASDNDSVALPPAIPGSTVYINNNTGHTLAVYGQASNENTGAGDTIAAHNSNTQQPTATGVTQATTVPGIYKCTTAGQWKQFLG